MPRLKNAQILLSQMSPAPTQEPELLKKTVPASKKTPKAKAEVPLADTLEPNKELEKTAVPPLERPKLEPNKTDGNDG